MNRWMKAIAMIEIIEIIHFNETWQRNTKAHGNCHGSLNVVAATTRIRVNGVFSIFNDSIRTERLVFSTFRSQI